MYVIAVIINWQFNLNANILYVCTHNINARNMYVAM